MRPPTNALSIRPATNRHLEDGSPSAGILRALVETSSDIISLHAADRTCLYVSPAVKTLLGRDPEQIIGTKPDDLVHPDDLPAIRDVDLRVDPTGAATFECRLRHADGSWRTFETTLRALPYDRGEEVEFMAVSRDVTERREILERLRESEQRHAEASEVERAASERLRALDDMKQAFLTSVSHDLRTPLTAVIGFAETLARYDDRLTPSTRRQLLTRLAVNATRLQARVKDLLDLDRLAGKAFAPSRQRIDVAAVVEAVAATSSVGNTHPLEVSCEGATVQADPALVERIVRNLLANAALHTERGTRVWVRVKPAEGGAVIEVDDAGPGVDHTIAREIFEPFRQGPTMSPESPRVGIGLSLVARFTELHGGRAWVEQRPGGGAAFRVFLPGEAVTSLAGRGEGAGVDDRARRAVRRQARGRGSRPLSGTRPSGS